MRITHLNLFQSSAILSLINALQFRLFTTISDAFQFKWGEDLMGDEEDRSMLEALPQIEREQARKILS